jgi:hypothetical protein
MRVMVIAIALMAACLAVMLNVMALQAELIRQARAIAVGGELAHPCRSTSRFKRLRKLFRRGMAQVRVAADGFQ